MNDQISQAKEGCERIDITLKKKLLSTNYDKSKYLLIENNNFRKKTLKKNGKGANANGRCKD